MIQVLSKITRLRSHMTPPPSPGPHPTCSPSEATTHTCTMAAYSCSRVHSTLATGSPQSLVQSLETPNNLKVSLAGAEILSRDFHVIRKQKTAPIGCRLLARQWRLVLVQEKEKVRREAKKGSTSAISALNRPRRQWSVCADISSGKLLTASC